MRSVGRGGEQEDVDMTNRRPRTGFGRWRLASAAGALAAGLALLGPTAAPAQTPPTETERAAYTGMHRAAASGDAAQIRKLLAEGADLKARDAAGRTPLHVAAF